MIECCKKLCQDPKKNKKKDKDGKHQKGDNEKQKHKVKNAYYHSITGANKKNVEQDTWTLIEIIEENVTCRFFAVYDGHGDFGKEASQISNQEVEAAIRRNIKKIIKWRELRDYKERVKKFFKQVYQFVQSRLNQNKKYYNQSGTCAVGLFQIEQDVFAINLGDSRIVMCNTEGGEISAMELSSDHKPFVQGEKDRIDKSGGEIMPKEGTAGPLRVWRKDEETPGLAVTRTLGDLVGHKIGISSDPDIEYWKIMNEDFFVILASDGVWDVMNSAEAVGYIIKETQDIRKAVIQLVQTARNLWEYQNNLKKQQFMKSMFGKNVHLKGGSEKALGAIDDITAVLVVFNTKIDKSYFMNTSQNTSQ